MKRTLFSLAAVVALAMPAAAQSDTSVVQLDAIVAIVGTVPITRYDVVRRLKDSVAALVHAGAPMPTAAERPAMITAILNDIIDEEVLLAKAKDLDIEVTDIEVNAATDEMMKQTMTQFTTQADLRQALNNAGLGTPDQYRASWAAQYRRNQTIGMVVQKLTADKKIPPVTIPETRVLKAFDDLKVGLQNRPATVSWRQMVVAPKPSEKAKIAAKAKADSLRAEIKAGGDFERIAKRETMDAATKETGGDLGWRRRGTLPDEIEHVLFGAFALRPGEVSPVIESPFGYHIVRIDKVNPPVEVKVRQILIVPKTDSNDVIRAEHLADSLTRAIRRGEPFDTTARRHHDPTEDAAGLMPETPIDSMPPSYQEGLKGVKKDSVVYFAIPTPSGPPKFVIAQVTSTNDGGTYTYAEMKARLRATLERIEQMRKYIDGQRNLLYVRVWADRALLALDAFPPG